MAKHKARKIVKKRKSYWIWGLLLLAVLVAGGAFLFQHLNTAQATLPDEITVTQAAAKKDQGAFILDVREQSEWDQFHIAGAALIPLGELSSRVNEVPKDRAVVVVCRTGNRSAQGRDILRDAGFTQVTSMAGGVTQWQAQGLPLVVGQ